MITENLTQPGAEWGGGIMGPLLEFFDSSENGHEKWAWNFLTFPKIHLGTFLGKKNQFPDPPLFSYAPFVKGR